MADPRTFVVVGAGLCGATTVATLRAEGFDGRVVLIGAEELPPYERPPLSKEYLRGEDPLEKIMVRPPEWFAEHDIETRFGTHVTQLDAHDRARSSGWRRTAWRSTRWSWRRADTTGGSTRPVRISPACSTSDTSADATRAIREAVDGGARVACVGMGFIGAEVAASLRTMGCDVTVIEIFETALYRVLGGDVGRVLEAIHRDHGVVMHFNDLVARFEGDGRLERVVTRSGRVVEADVAVVGIGTVARRAHHGRDRVRPARAASPSDRRWRRRSPACSRSGDVARHEHPVFGPMRVEHFDNALKMGEAVARNMLGADAVFDDPHWFWSDQYDVQVQMAGFAPTWDRMVVRGSLEDRSFCAFLLDADGVLRSSVSIAWPRDVRRSFELIRRAVRPDPAALADPDVDLRTLSSTEG